jgi:AbiV family abortive infection protein
VGRPLPKPAEAFAGGQAAIFNAENLFESAEDAAKRGNFGVAVGLVVLAIEEAVKARALFGFLLASKIGAPFGLDDDAFRDILYRNHALRHSLAFWQGMSSAMHTAWVSGVMPMDDDGRKALERDESWVQPVRLGGRLARTIPRPDSGSARGLG